MRLKLARCLCANFGAKCFITLCAIVLGASGLLTLEAEAQGTGGGECYFGKGPGCPEKTKLACIDSRVKELSASRIVAPVDSSVRCPGGGCLFQSGDCNKRSATAQLSASSGFVLDQYRLEQGGSNNGSTGGIRTASNSDGVTSIFVDFQCDPPDHPGAEGGWNSVKLHSFERPTASRLAQIQEEARQYCITP